MFWDFSCSSVCDGFWEISWKIEWFWKVFQLFSFNHKNFSKLFTSKHQIFSWKLQMFWQGNFNLHFFQFFKASEVKKHSSLPDSNFMIKWFVSNKARTNKNVSCLVSFVSFFKLTAGDKGKIYDSEIRKHVSFFFILFYFGVSFVQIKEERKRGSERRTVIYEFKFSNLLSKPKKRRKHRKRHFEVCFLAKLLLESSKY